MGGVGRVTEKGMGIGMGKGKLSNSVDRNSLLRVILKI